MTLSGGFCLTNTNYWLEYTLMEKPGDKSVDNVDNLVAINNILLQLPIKLTK